MHISDAIISPVVGGVGLATAAGMIRYSIKRINNHVFENKLPLMAVTGALLFALQMINFSIPGTGSSGHLSGGLLLAIILGPKLGFITMSIVLLIQALFFADGGILAIGCNLINMGGFACFLAYPYIYSKIVSKKKNIMFASIVSSIISVELAAFFASLAIFLSGRIMLDFPMLLLFMLPIHLAIAVVEGVITGSIVIYLKSQNEELIYSKEENTKTNKNLRKPILGIFVGAIIIGGLISVFASSNPDGLEWSLEKVNATISSDRLSDFIANLAILPDYGIRDSDSSLGTTVSGVVGSISTIVVVLVLGLLVKKRRKFND